MENLFRKNAVDYQRTRLAGTIYLIQNSNFNYFTLLIVAITVISAVFLALGSYVRKEKVEGVLEPIAGSIRLVAPMDGVVSDLLVSEGELVEKDQAILRISSSRFNIGGEDVSKATIEKYRSQLAILDTQIHRLKPQHALDVNLLKGEYEQLKIREQGLVENSNLLTERFQLNQKIVDKLIALEGTGYISEVELKLQQDKLMSIRQQINSERSELNHVRSSLEQSLKRISKLKIQQQQEIDEFNSNRADLEIKIFTASQNQSTEVRAPKSGIVTNLLVKSGEAIGKEQTLFNMLPIESHLQAVFYVPTRAIGFLRAGQQVRVRYHAFPYEKFGVHTGFVKDIGETVVLPSDMKLNQANREPSYRVVVGIDKQFIPTYGKETKLRAGMGLDADIVIEERTLIAWLFDSMLSLKGAL